MRRITLIIVLLAVAAQRMLQALHRQAQVLEKLGLKVSEDVAAGSLLQRMGFEMRAVSACSTRATRAVRARSEKAGSARFTPTPRCARTATVAPN